MREYYWFPAEKYAAVIHSDVDNHNSTRDEAEEGIFYLDVSLCFHNIAWLFTPENKNGRLVDLEDYDLVIINTGPRLISRRRNDNIGHRSLDFYQKCWK